MQKKNIYYTRTIRTQRDIMVTDELGKFSNKSNTNSLFRFNIKKIAKKKHNRKILHYYTFYTSAFQKSASLFIFLVNIFILAFISFKLKVTYLNLAYLLHNPPRLIRKFTQSLLQFNCWQLNFINSSSFVKLHDIFTQRRQLKAATLSTVHFSQFLVNDSNLYCISSLPNIQWYSISFFLVLFITVITCCILF